MYGIRKILLEQERNDYSEHLSEKPFELDCSMGSNPYGSYPGLTLGEDVIAHLNLYPESDKEITGLLAKRYQDVCTITDDMVAYSCGSIGSMLACNRMLLEPGKDVICIAPTFTAVTDDMLTYEPKITYVPLLPEHNYKLDVEDLLAKVKELPGAYVYIDNPNNPTGQIYPLAEMRRVVEEAEKQGSFVVLDEAYGDYMPLEESGLNLVNEFDNLAVVRTFSKGMAQAGARLGYTIAKPYIIAALGKVNVPISKSSLADALAIQMLKSDWAEQTVARVLRDKPRVLGALKNLKVAHTALSVPISMIFTDKKDVNLEEVFGEVGIRAVTCEGYEGLGANAVRLNLHDNIDRLVTLVQKADALMA